MRVNEAGEVVQDVWNLALKSIDEREIYSEGQKARHLGSSKHANPWPSNTYAHLVWYDGWLNV